MKVSVKRIDAVKRELKFEIPKERVTGPWVFVDLPPGTYDLSAARDGETRERKNFKILPNSTRSLYFRWP